MTGPYCCSKYFLAQAATQASRQRSLPLWVYALMVLLGWNELMAVLGSPIKLALVVVLGMFVVTLYSVRPGPGG